MGMDSTLHRVGICVTPTTASGRGLRFGRRGVAVISQFLSPIISIPPTPSFLFRRVSTKAEQYETMGDLYTIQDDSKKVFRHLAQMEAKNRTQILFQIPLFVGPAQIGSPVFPVLPVRPLASFPSLPSIRCSLTCHSVSLRASIT